MLSTNGASTKLTAKQKEVQLSNNDYASITTNNFTSDESTLIALNNACANVQIHSYSKAA